jgi:hypothetical protein
MEEYDSSGHIARQHNTMMAVALGLQVACKSTASEQDELIRQEPKLLLHTLTF